MTDSPHSEGVKLTPAMRRVLQHVADNGPLRSTYHDWPARILPRLEVRRRLWAAGLISTPNMNAAGSRCWEITPAGRLALQSGNQERGVS